MDITAKRDHDGQYILEMGPVFFELPHRQSVALFRASKGWPYDRSTVMPPLNHNAPSGVTTIAAGRSGSNE